MDREAKLVTNSAEREMYDNLGELFSIIVATEHLERAYIRDNITAQEYTPACLKFIAQFKTSVSLLQDTVPDVREFMREYQLTCPAAVKRLLEIGIPATVEHATESVSSNNSARYVAEAVQFFITLMDSLKLNYVAVDQIHPQLSDLILSLNRVQSMPKDYEGKGKIKTWLIALNKLKASDELSEEQVRQLLFDLESAYSEFQRSLASK
ncbi:hypothetical protein BATDEDRAFT_27998 [Batrachochytrium dendrobatidis JAM81]|uniref:Vacuolar protein sorting-associated protein 28 n=1 Tax=Batrachochytrium dendrobatidis (strain JAM81 / FGSC 10211) TaxID=684364 RepID=F4PCZ7_BATDJ|nr:ESCRT-I subunit protein VPS28 [Batrachochytrium dendrobatidis JAM81]EGF76948.1 hypothetical protein BATDEDRAFT_27998 [Batrachochytrium dendrobatidis JAM81]|eukprot:XP_006682386.1 hypothetical protein BATDEDRAFT_27998 [Batrachochytrium dendrobatidis JAM81]